MSKPVSLHFQKPGFDRLSLRTSLSKTMQIPINLLQYQSDLKTKIEGGKSFVFDPIRKKYYLQQPEEMVRQLLLIYFQKELNLSKNYIAVEKTLKVNGLPKRFDILIFDKNHHPVLLVETKSPKVKISESTFKQISWYNMTLKVPFLLVTNGINTYCCSVNYEENRYEFLKKIPDLR